MSTLSAKASPSYRKCSASPNLRIQDIPYLLATEEQGAPGQVQAELSIVQCKSEREVGSCTETYNQKRNGLLGPDLVTWLQRR